MDPKDFNFTMKSGRDIQTETDSNIDNTQLDDIMAIILTFAENAIESADVYCRHANRRVIIDKDIKMGMQWEVFMYLQRDNSKKLTKNLEKISNFKNDEEHQLDSNLDILSESNENHLFDIPTTIDEPIQETYTKSTCKCNICESMNNTDKLWNNWTPTNPIEKIFKYNIDRF